VACTLCALSTVSKNLLLLCLANWTLFVEVTILLIALVMAVLTLYDLLLSHCM